MTDIVPGITIDIAKLLTDNSGSSIIFDPNGIDGTPTITNGFWLLWGEGYHQARRAVEALFVKTNAVGVQGAWRYRQELPFEMLPDGYNGFTAVVPAPGVYHRMDMDVFSTWTMGDGCMPTVEVSFDAQSYRLGKDGEFKACGSKKKPHDVRLQIGWCIALRELGFEVMSCADADELSQLALARKGTLCGACMPCK